MNANVLGGAFLPHAPQFFTQPDTEDPATIERVRAKSVVQPQGIDPFLERDARPPGPPRILWAARWEFDKDPDTLFEACAQLRERGVDFRLSVIGEQFRASPPAFDWAEKEFADHIDRWGYQASRDDYQAALLDADVIVSTAQHEFFGISVVEAVAAGCYPLAPRRLAYPEVLAGLEGEGKGPFFYDGGALALTESLVMLAERIAQDSLQYRYQVIDIRDIDCRRLLASPTLEDNLLALLCGLDDEAKVVRTVLGKIAGLDENSRRDALQWLEILSGLRPLKPVIQREIEKMPISLNLKENPFFQEAFAEGEQKGRAEGRLEGEYVLLSKQLEKRFGPLPENIVDRLKGASPKQLEAWGLRLLSAETLEEVFSGNA